MDNNKPVKLKKTLFSIKSLTKKFPNGFEALSGIDLEIYEGECTLIAGANGSGKTVLMKILSGLMDSTSGEILYKGNNLDFYGKSYKSMVGLVFQDADAQILGETVEEDIRFGPENLKLPDNEIESRLEDALAVLELSQKREFTARHLSGGEKRRLITAGILAMGSETVILDEPFANLDWPGVIQVQKIIKSLKENKKNVIVLSHELEKILPLSDRIVILAEGKVQCEGECEAVLDSLIPAWGVRDPRIAYNSEEL